MALSSNRSGNQAFNLTMWVRAPLASPIGKAGPPIRTLFGTMWRHQMGCRWAAKCGVMVRRTNGDAKLPNEIGLNLNWKKPKLGR